VYRRRALAAGRLCGTAPVHVGGCPWASGRRDDCTPAGTVLGLRVRYMKISVQNVAPLPMLENHHLINARDLTVYPP
jgi:hypothetical protein